jgi:hypothetical protein
MPVFKRELAFDADRPGVNTGDWWHLVLETDEGGLYIEHSWHHASMHTQGEAARGSQRFGINDFLTLATNPPARAALITALSERFREARQP